MVWYSLTPSATLSNGSFTWSNVPYPLPYIPTAHYEIELIPELPANRSTNHSSPSTTVKSPLFSFSPLPRNPPPDSSVSPPPQPFPLVQCAPSRIPTPQPAIKPTNRRTNAHQTPGLATPEGEQPGGPGTNAIIIAVCISLGIPISIATAVCIWWTRRHRRRAKYEESRRTRYETIID